MMAWYYVVLIIFGLLYFGWKLEDLDDKVSDLRHEVDELTKAITDPLDED